MVRMNDERLLQTAVRQRNREVAVNKENHRDCRIVGLSKDRPRKYRGIRKLEFKGPAKESDGIPDASLRLALSI